ncbi:hypothetical protein Dimus_009516 [Dionaea muscipula]
MVLLPVVWGYRLDLETQFSTTKLMLIKPHKHLTNFSTSLGRGVVVPFPALPQSPFSSSLLAGTRDHPPLRRTSHAYTDERLHHLLQASTDQHSLKAVHCFHALVIAIGSYARQPIFFLNNVIYLYGSLGELYVACKVFDRMPERNAVSYNSVISACSREGHLEMAWDVFCEMWGSGFAPTHATFGSLLSFDALDMRRGCMLHGLMLKNGLFFSDAFAGTALLGMFGRLGLLDEARRVFEDLPRKCLITWNSMISLLCCHGFVGESLSFFGDLRRSNYGLSGSTFVSVLSGILGEEELAQIHGFVLKNGFDYEVSVSNTLVNAYVKCSGVGLAEKTLKEMPVQDVVSYNTVIGAYAKDERSQRAFELLQGLSASGILPNETTYVGLINCCASLRVAHYGEYVHAKVIRNAFQYDVFVGSALVDFYGKCDKPSAARRCFNELPDKNVTSWNALITTYSTKCCNTQISLLHDMLRSGYRPNEFTFSTLIKTSLVPQLQLLHCLAIRMGCQKNEYVFSSLVKSYAKNGLISDALTVAASFEMPLPVVSANIMSTIYSRIGQYEQSLEILSLLDEPDNVSWNVLLSACSHKGYYDEVFEIFRFMLMAKVPYDNFTVVSVLSACTKLCSLALGSCVHDLLVKTNFEQCDTFVCNILIDMYAKCGSVESSVKIFKETSGKNLITWTCLISALGHHGCAREALERFREMLLLGVKPDRVALIALLSACRHGGLVEEGMELFSEMEKLYGVNREIDHYLGAVGLLVRGGHLNEAEEVIGKMPFPRDAQICRSFLAGQTAKGTGEGSTIARGTH